MTSYSITGRTYDARELLKSWRAKWDGVAWTLDNPSSAMLAKLRGTPGLIVTECAAPAPVEREPMDFAALLARIERTIDGTRPPVLYGDDPSLINAFDMQNPVVHFGFSSLSAYVDYIERVAPTNSAQQGQEAGAAFTGTDTLAQAVKLARQGWSEGFDLAAQVVEHIGVRHALQRRRSHSVAGGSVNVGRMLSGNPSHMIRRPKLPGRRVVTLYVETGCNAHINTESMVARAGAVAAVADVMEQRGYSCEIVATDTSIDSARCMQQLAVRIKDAGQRLNVADVVFALGHPSMVRRFGFIAVCSARELRDIWQSQGSAADMFKDAPRNGYYVKHLKSNLRDGTIIDKALAAVRTLGLAKVLSDDTN